MNRDCTALILCGGKSSRMGTDKPLLAIGGQTMLSRAAAFWRPLCAEVLLAAGRDGHFQEIPEGVRQVFDQFPNCGPLGGVHAGLLAMETEYLIVSAVDMPYLERAAAQALLDAGRNHDACVYRLEGRPEPLFGLYRRTCLPAAEAQLQEGRLAMSALLQRLDTVFLETDRPDLFVNVNTPDAFAQVRQQLEGQP